MTQLAITPRFDPTTELMIEQDISISELGKASQNPALVYLASVSASSRRIIIGSLRAIAALDGDERWDCVRWGDLRYQHTQAIRTKLEEVYNASTANRHLSALRGVLKEAWRLGYMSAEEYQRAIDLKAIKGSKVSQAEAGRHLTPGEIKGLMDACQDRTKAGARDAAIIAVGYGCGLRRSEIAKLDLASYSQDEGSLLVVGGKGNKDRLVFLPTGTADAIGAWLEIRGNAAGRLFLSIRKGDHLETKGLTDQAIYNILEHRAKVGGIKSFTPHDLRRTFAGDLLDTGEDISTVQKMMGHANANTTAGYDRRDSRTKKRAASKLNVPFFKQAKLID